MRQGQKTRTEDKTRTAAPTQPERILVQSQTGIVTDRDLKRVCEEYMDQLPNPELIYSKVQCFDGLLNYIYRVLLSYVLGDSYYNDYDILDRIFYDIYVPLCNSYGYIPNVLQFCIVTKIDNSNISRLNNKYIDNIDSNSLDDKEKVIYKRSQTVKGWYKYLESCLSSSVANNNSIGSMFLLKAKYGYQETQGIQVQTIDQSPRLSLDELDALDTTEDSTPALPKV